MKKRGFTLIEVLAVIVILALIFLITHLLIGAVVQRVHAEACKANMRSMEHAAHNYFTLNEDNVLPTVGQESEVSLVQLMNQEYITPVFDPATKQLVDLYESKVLVKNEITGPELTAYISSPTCSGEGTEPEGPGDLGEELIWDGWMRLTLYYPESSTERKWRLSEEGEIRSDPLLLWQNYEGPILVPLSRTADVWISYKIGEETVIVPPAGRFLVDIQANPVGGNNVEKVTVTITYDKDASLKEYRVGNSGWISYTGAFEVSENTVIEARGSKDDEVYDNQGNYLMTRKIAGRDLLYVNYIGMEESQLEAPAITRAAGVDEGEVARVNVTYPEGAVRTVYKINYGPEEEYTGNIPVTRYGTHVIAYYYDAEGNRSLSRSIMINEAQTPSNSYTPVGPNTPITSNPNKPESSVPAPSFSVTPQTITNSVEVSVNAPANADKVYIKTGRNNSYQRYHLPITVTKNTEVYAYYITYDGYRSDVGYGRVSNIKEDAKPYLRIDASPYPYSGRYGDTSVEVSIISQDATTTEYSLDGIVYQAYLAPFVVTENRRIYARAVNAVGETKQILDITNIGKLQTPSSLTRLNVGINVVPESTGNQRFSSVKVTIDYDSRATGKYYRLGNTGPLQEYTGEITVTSNTTVYAYALGTNAKGEESRLIDSLLTGITEPKIRVYPSGEASKVTVQITYDKYASVKRYRLDNGTWTDYTGEFVINKNETKIDAYNQNSAGQRAESSLTIENIIPSPPVVMIDKGNYFILKLNYPPGSNNREYKFKETGEWKSYKEAGILLIKSKYKDQVIQNGSLIQIENEHGQMVNFTGDYYLLDVPINEVLENVFMRWDKETPAAPTILQSTTSPTREVDVTISYPGSAVLREYKMVKPNGESTGWIPYENTFKVTQKNMTVYARAMNSTEVWSVESIKKITNIDEQNPSLTLTADLETPSRTLGIRVAATDDTGVSMVKWAPDIRDANYFRASGTVIPNNSVFIVLMNGTYSVYVEDQVGNHTIETITITNIDNQAPDIEINTSPAFELGTSVGISIDFGDSTTRQYKIGASNPTWSNYTTPVNLTSYQVLQNGWKNPDNTVTVYARGVDSASNETIVTKKILNLDLDIPATPVITSSYGYPILTSYGVIFDGSTTIAFDQREGFLHEYSLDNGSAWQEYTGEFQATAGVVRARSTKESTGLRVEANKTNSMPSDALMPSGYDGNYDSGYNLIRGNSNFIKVDSSVQTMKFRAKFYARDTAILIRFLDDNQQQISQISRNSGSSRVTYDELFTIPEGTMWISYLFTTAGSSPAVTFYDMGISNEPTFNATNGYMLLHTDLQKTIQSPYQMVTINYFPTSVQKLYRIGTTGEWLSYQNQPIKVNQGQTIYAKGIDQGGNETRIHSSYTANVTDALLAAGFDGDYINGYALPRGNNNYIKVDASMHARKFRAKFYAKDTAILIRFLDENQQLISQISRNSSSSRVTYDELFTIPEGTMWISYLFTTAGSSPAVTFYDMGMSNEPVFITTNGYMLLHEDLNQAIKNPYQMISIDYFPTSVQRLYQVGTEGQWLPYQNQPIKVDQGQTIYAKGIDQYGNETRLISSHVSNSTDALKVAAFDGDWNTYVHGITNNLIQIHSSMAGKQVRVKWKHTSSPSSAQAHMIYLNSDRQEISRVTLPRPSVTSTVDTTYTLPIGTAWISVTASAPYSSTGYFNAFYDIAPLN